MRINTNLYYFDDFTMYSNRNFEKAFNIGWLSKPDNDESHEIDQALAVKIIKYLNYPVNMLFDVNNNEKAVFNGKEYTAGNHEIRVLAKDNTIYAAPDHVIIRILNGTYRPPEAFRKAVIYGVDPDSDEYWNFYSNRNSNNMWGAGHDYADRGECLTECIQKNDIFKLKSLLSEAPDDINIVTEYGSLLNAALIMHRSNIAMWLINNGADLNNYNGMELISAIRNNMNVPAKHLLKSDISSKTVSYKTNPLYAAVETGNRTIAVELLKFKKLYNVHNAPNEDYKNVFEWINSYGDQFIKSLAKKERETLSQKY